MSFDVKFTVRGSTSLKISSIYEYDNCRSRPMKTLKLIHLPLSCIDRATDNFVHYVIEAFGKKNSKASFINES